MLNSEILHINDIIVEDRFRVEMGDIKLLADSIKEFGLIQPIVVGDECSDPNGPRPKLIAGGRRLAAMKSLGFQELRHGDHWVHRAENELTEVGKYRFRAMELEENVKRKEMTWPEQVRAKKELLDLMQKIHGVPLKGKPRNSDGDGGSGFSLRKLAAMLGESVGTVQRDLLIATAVDTLPVLAKAPTKESAFRQTSILVAIHGMRQKAKQAPPSVQNWTLYEGSFKDHSKAVADGTVDLVYTDLPFGVDLSKMSKHDAGTVQYADDRNSVVRDLEFLASESFRVLHDNRYAIFFFGFNYYPELVAALTKAGFSVNLVPIVWYKHTNSTENPNTRYGNAYDPALVCTKGSPVFLRPGHQNVVDLAPVSGTNKLQIAQQPVTLVERFILDMVAAGSTVLDWCAGSGTTGEAALKNKCKAILFEREAAACQLIKARLGAFKVTP